MADQSARERVDALLASADEIPEAALEAAIPKATDALYDTREGDGNMHEAGRAAAVAALKTALPVVQAEDDGDLGQIRALLGHQGPGLVQEVEKLLKVRENLNKADMVAVLGNKGRSGSVRFKGMGNAVPFEVTVDYGEEDDPPLTMRRVTLKAGWSAKDWRAMDRSALHDEETEPETVKA